MGLRGDVGVAAPPSAASGPAAAPVAVAAVAVGGLAVGDAVVADGPAPGSPGGAPTEGSLLINTVTPAAFVGCVPLDADGTVTFFIFFAGGGAASPAAAGITAAARDDGDAADKFVATPAFAVLPAKGL